MEASSEVDTFKSNVNYAVHYTPLITAVDRGFADNVLTLIKAGADVNAKTLDNWTALHFAVFQFVKMLIDAGADANARTTNNHSSLILTAPEGWERFPDDCVECVKLLLKAGADVNVRGNNVRNAIETCIVIR